MVRKPYTWHIIGESIQQLEGFQNAMELDLTMGYYIIELSTEIRDLTIIVTEFGKFKYNRAPMGLYASGDIF